MNGLSEFSQHPISYTYSANRDFVKDYWDLGTVLFAGYALGDKFGDNHFDDFGLLIGITGAYIGTAMGPNGSTPRLARNTAAYFASIGYFSPLMSHEDVSLQTGAKLFTGFMATLALIGEIGRKKEKSNDSISCQNLTLENCL